MAKIIEFPVKGANTEQQHGKSNDQPTLPALANNVTIVLIQQALNDACTSKDWKGAKRKIDAAIKRGHLHILER